MEDSTKESIFDHKDFHHSELTLRSASWQAPDDIEQFFFVINWYHPHEIKVTEEYMLYQFSIIQTKLQMTNINIKRTEKERYILHR